MNGFSVTGLAVARGGICLLENISFALAPKQALILRGPNGLGKTSLLRVLAGLTPAWSGTIECNPEDCVYAGHQDGIKSALSVEENLYFWAEIFGHCVIQPALDAFDLQKLAMRPAAHLSAGQKRRLGLARLVVSKRSIWLLDEPTVSLDTASTKRFTEILTSHLGDGGIAVISTHVDLDIEAQSLELENSRLKADQTHKNAAFQQEDGYF